MVQQRLQRGHGPQSGPRLNTSCARASALGVLKRYVGCLLGVILSSLLFAAAHAHLPSFVPLFVLGSCFAIAYEWSDSILVTMTMHSLFNSLTLTALAFPEFISQ